MESNAVSWAFSSRTCAGCHQAVSWPNSQMAKTIVLFKSVARKRLTMVVVLSLHGLNLRYTFIFL
eukprot:1509929-Amphidinium_carterae.1